ncbi:MAG: NADH-quinone oxidoreductase subunit M [Verrucomicrobiales bacterium]|nr:NADH-quinone oxidoreductase subunit M [Verrucomicrobiales bacterium]
MELVENPSQVPLLSLLIFAPLCAAVAVLLLRRERAVRWWALGFTLAEALAALGLLFKFDPSVAGFQLVERARWIPWLGASYALGVDGVSLWLVLLTVGLLPLCVLCSWRQIQHRVKEFMVCLLVLESALIGVFCALDAILFFVFWEAVLIPMSLVIGVWGGARRVYAAIKFFVYTMAGSLFLLGAVIALYQYARTFSIPELMQQKYGLAFQVWIFLALAIAFGVKVPMFPLHTWLPAAHVEAPTAGSVLLASVLLKMGTYGFVRFCLSVTADAARLFAPWMVGLSVIAILYGGLVALAQTDLKRLVAYSSIGHMGFATLGIFVLNRSGLDGALFVMLSHGITTGALFIAVGVVYERLHTRELAHVAGLGKSMPMFTMLLGVFALASLAFPGTNNFVGEFLVLAGTFAWAREWAGPGWTMLVLLTIPGLVVAAAYNLRMLQKVAFGSASNPNHSGVRDLGLRELVTLLPLCALVVWIGLNPGPFMRAWHASVEWLIQRF